MNHRSTLIGCLFVFGVACSGYGSDENGPAGPQGAPGAPGPQGQQGPAGPAGRSILPAGVIVPFAGKTPPEGWLLCDGASVAKVQYPDLFNVIDLTYGGDATNFRLPDLRGRSAIGAGTGAGPLATTEGITDEAARAPMHDHALDLDTSSVPDHEHRFRAPLARQSGGVVNLSIVDPSHLSVPGDGSYEFIDVEDVKQRQTDTEVQGPAEIYRVHTSSAGAHGHKVSGRVTTAKQNYLSLNYIIKY